MNIFKTQKDNPTDIFYLNPEQERANTKSIFEVTKENGRLRVKNSNVNCLFSKLTPESFDEHYNKYVQHLNLDFEPTKIEGEIYQLTEAEQEQLRQNIITYWMYYYSVNNLKIKVRRSDFQHPYMVDQTIQILDVKYGTDTTVSMTLGAKILRQPLSKHTRTVEQRRQYYDR